MNSAYNTILLYGSTNSKSVAVVANLYPYSLKQFMNYPTSFLNTIIVSYYLCDYLKENL